MAEVTGSAVERLRTERGWSQERLARELECSVTTVRRLEAGDNNPSWVLAHRLARVLDVTLNDLQEEH